MYYPPAICKLDINELMCVSNAIAKSSVVGIYMSNVTLAEYADTKILNTWSWKNSITTNRWITNIPSPSPHNKCMCAIRHVWIRFNKDPVVFRRWLYTTNCIISVENNFIIIQATNLRKCMMMGNNAPLFLVKYWWLFTLFSLYHHCKNIM